MVECTVWPDDSEPLGAGDEQCCYTIRQQLARLHSRRMVSSPNGVRRIHSVCNSATQWWIRVVYWVKGEIFYFI